MTRVKICGITTPEDAVAAAEAGADAIGLVFHPGSPRYVTAQTARRIVEALPPMVSAVGVFVNHADPASLEDMAMSIGLHAVQLHGMESPDYCSLIQRLKVIKAFRIDASFRPESLRNYDCAAFLIDGGRPGSGEAFDWNLVQGLEVAGPVILAGGLNPGNVARAISKLRPFAVDVSSGVESAPGQKDRTLIEQFIASVRCA